jgi:phosphoribosylaminoimidazolecarboxamide formyltransferase/IMP cyclohydrolase
MRARVGRFHGRGHQVRAEEEEGSVSVNIVEKVDDRVRVRHALISVSDKEGLEPLVKDLLRIVPDLKIFSTGGTYARIEEILGKEAGSTLVQVSAYTGQPETQGGLVKTLDFKIYLGLLTEAHNPLHQEDLRRTGAVPIDLVVVNLYPFHKTVERPGVTLEEARANIDIGGPCMVRASAKNFHRVAIVVDPTDYSGLTASLEANGGCTRLAERFGYAQKAFGHTAAYDRHIMDYLEGVRFSEASGCYDIQPETMGDG